MVGRSNGATLGFEETLWQAADKMPAITNGSCGSLRPRCLEGEIHKSPEGLGFDV
jgi:hypothetical protein